MSCVKFPSHFISGTMIHFYTVLLALRNSYEQPLSALEKISYHTAAHHTLNLAHPHLVLTASQPPHSLTLTTRYTNSLGWPDALQLRGNLINTNNLQNVSSLLKQTFIEEYKCPMCQRSNKQVKLNNIYFTYIYIHTCVDIKCIYIYTHLMSTCVWHH